MLQTSSDGRSLVAAEARLGSARNGRNYSVRIDLSDAVAPVFGDVKAPIRSGGDIDRGRVSCQVRRAGVAGVSTRWVTGIRMNGPIDRVIHPDQIIPGLNPEDFAGSWIDNDAFRRIYLSTAGWTAIATVSLSAISGNGVDNSFGVDDPNPVVESIGNINIALRVHRRSMRVIEVRLPRWNAVAVVVLQKAAVTSYLRAVLRQLCAS